MIASLDGTVGTVGLDALVIDVGGVGYRVFTTPALLVSARAGNRLRVHTHHLVAEDRQALFGFATPEELGFFQLLLTVTGVGPKVALAIVGSRPVADLQLAILQQDQAALTGIQGIGKKLAERVVFELKEKVAAAGTAAAAAGGSVVGGETEVIAALQALGYSPLEARQASRLAIGDATIGGTLEDRVKAALRTLLRD